MPHAFHARHLQLGWPFQRPAVGVTAGMWKTAMEFVETAPGLATDSATLVMTSLDRQILPAAGSVLIWMTAAQTLSVQMTPGGEIQLAAAVLTLRIKRSLALAACTRTPSSHAHGPAAPVKELATRCGTPRPTGPAPVAHAPGCRRRMELYATSSWPQEWTADKRRFAATAASHLRSATEAGSWTATDTARHGHGSATASATTVARPPTTSTAKRTGGTMGTARRRAPSGVDTTLHHVGVRQRLRSRYCRHFPARATTRF